MYVELLACLRVRSFRTGRFSVIIILLNWLQSKSINRSNRVLLLICIIIMCKCVFTFNIIYFIYKVCFVYLWISGPVGFMRHSRAMCIYIFIRAFATGGGGGLLELRLCVLRIIILLCCTTQCKIICIL